MDNSDLIQKIRDHLRSGSKDAYTEPLLAIGRKAIAEHSASQGQQAELVLLVKELEKLHNLPPEMLPPGSSATSF
jgi:hypothetical protein